MLETIWCFESAMMENAMKRYLFLIGICCFWLPGCDDDNEQAINPDNSHHSGQTADNPDASEDNSKGTQDTTTEIRENVTCDPSCEEGFQCENGECLPICTDALTFCDGECLSLTDIHMTDCNTCEGAFENCDGDIQNGCEVDVSSDVNHCGECGNACDEGSYCSAGECISACNKGEIACDGECISQSELHLKSCTECADGYCDSDGNFQNGCDTNFLSDDVNNCGACGQKCEGDLICRKGVCQTKCAETETLCGENCIDLGKIHKSSCNKCAAGYENCDGKEDNGCEVAINGSDAKNCGACGKACGIGESCTNSQCQNSYNVHRRFIVATNTLPVRASASDSAEKYGDLPLYSYFKALGEKNGWYLVEYNKKAGWVNGAFTISAGDQYAGRKAVDLAEKYLYTTTGFCTFDHLTHSPILQNFTNLYNYSGCYYGYENNCANFTTSILVSTGLASVNEIGSWETKAYYCEQHRGGYRIVDKTQAKPGDIWYKDASAGKHIELVIGYHNGNYVLIGSNNFNASNYSPCANTYPGVDVSHYQRVSYDYRSDGYICSRQ